TAEEVQGCLDLAGELRGRRFTLHLQVLLQPAVYVSDKDFIVASQTASPSKYQIARLEKRVDDDDSVHSRCEPANLVNNAFKSISGGCLKRDRWRIELRRSCASSSAALDDGTFLNRLRSAEQCKSRTDA